MAHQVAQDPQPPFHLLALAADPGKLALQRQHLVQSPGDLGEKFQDAGLFLLLIADAGLNVAILLSHILGVGMDVLDLAQLRGGDEEFFIVVGGHADRPVPVAGRAPQNP